MRILIITQKVDKDDSLLGFFHYWIENIAQLVDSVTVIALSVGSYNLPPNVRVVSLGKENGAPKWIQAVRFYWSALWALRSCDGVFVHMAPEYVRALYPVNIFFRRPILMWYAHIKVSPTAKWAIRHVDRVLTPSKESFEFDSDKVIATGHGIDTDLFAPEPALRREPPLILTMSRISRVKRLEVFIEALRLLREAHPNLMFRAMLAGKLARPEDAEYEQELRRLVRKAALEDRISWFSDITNSDMPRVYNEASVFIRMQGGGGFGKSELAAMACGIPSIVPTDVYNRDLGDFAQDTYFVEDDASMLADRISTVLSWTSDRRTEYARLARAIVVQHHNVRQVAAQIVELLKQAQKV